MKFDGFGHINIVIDDLEKAADYYAGLLGTKKVQEFPHFKNIGVSKCRDRSIGLGLAPEPFYILRNAE